MTLEPGEFIRRFLLHVLPKGFHRIRHYGLLANGGTKRADKLARARELIAAAPQLAPPPPAEQVHSGTCEDTVLPNLDHPCPHCACRMVIIEVFEAGCPPRHPPPAPAPITQPPPFRLLSPHPFAKPHLSPAGGGEVGAKQIHIARG